MRGLSNLIVLLSPSYLRDISLNQKERYRRLASGFSPAHEPKLSSEGEKSLKRRRKGGVNQTKLRKVP